MVLNKISNSDNKFIPSNNSYELGFLKFEEVIGYELIVINFAAHST